MSGLIMMSDRVVVGHEMGGCISGLIRINVEWVGQQIYVNGRIGSDRSLNGWSNGSVRLR